MKFRVNWCTCSMYIISLSFYFLKNLTEYFLRYELARLGMGTIFLVGERNEPPSDKLGGENLYCCACLYVCLLI